MTAPIEGAVRAYPEGMAEIRGVGGLIEMSGLAAADCAA